MWLPQIGEVGKVVGVRPDLIRRDLSIGHQCQLDIDHIIGEFATIEETRRTRIVVGQDVWEQKLGDAICLLLTEDDIFDDLFVF